VQLTGRYNKIRRFVIRRLAVLRNVVWMTMKNGTGQTYKASIGEGRNACSFYQEASWKNTP
jgi:hypothetical protein